MDEDTVKDESPKPVERETSEPMDIPTDLKIDIDQLTLGDLEDLTDNNVPLTAKEKILARLVVNMPIRRIRMLDLPKVIDKVADALTEATNPT